MKKFLKYTASYGCALIFAIVGLVLDIKAPNKVLFICLFALSALPILFFAVNFVVSKLYVKRINQTKVADMHSYMLGHRKEAEDASDSLLKKLQGLRRVTIFYTVILWLLAVCASLFSGMVYNISSWLYYPCLFYAGTIFHVVYSRIPKKQPIVLDKDAPVLNREEYPNIYDMAYGAASDLGCKGEITILINLDCNAGVLFDGNGYYLQIGIILLKLLSEEELYTIFLHEFSHCSEKNRDIDYELKYGGWLSADRQTDFDFISTHLFSAFDIYYLFNHLTFRYAISVIKETEADSDMAKYGNPKAASSALLKLNYYDRLEWESGVENEDAVYEAELPNPHHLRERIEKIKNAIETRQDVWADMVKKEILPNNASHPIVRMRLETFGVNEYELIKGKSSEGYLNEVENALDFADKQLFDFQKDCYDEDRKENYLEPLERITQWKEKGMPILAEEYVDIITALKQIGLNREAEELCDRAINELETTSSPHAYFMKGCALIHRYDKSGVDYIYRAIENNHNYLEEGLDAIGAFYCLMGMEDELKEYRQKAQQLLQKEKDEYSQVGYLTKNDILTCDDMPKDMLEDILSFIKSVDEDIIEDVFLVKKTITEDFFSSVFVIRFYGGTDKQRFEIMHKIFRFLDSYPVERQFSLFDYFEYPEVKIDKIQGSHVYSKSNYTGEQQ